MAFPWSIQQIKELLAKFPLKVADGGTGGIDAASALAALGAQANMGITSLGGPPASLNFGATGSAGSATAVARADHTHGMPAAPSDGMGANPWVYAIGATNIISVPENGFYVIQVVAGGGGGGGGGISGYVGGGGGRGGYAVRFISLPKGATLHCTVGGGGAGGTARYGGGGGATVVACSSPSFYIAAGGGGGEGAAYAATGASAGGSYETAAGGAAGAGGTATSSGGGGVHGGVGGNYGAYQSHMVISAPWGTSYGVGGAGGAAGAGGTAGGSGVIFIFH